MGIRAQTALLLPFPLGKWRDSQSLAVRPHFYLQSTGSATELRLVYFAFSLWELELHRMGLLSSPFFPASRNSFRRGVRAIAVPLYSAFAFFLFAHAVANVVLGSTCLENGCEWVQKLSVADIKVLSFGIWIF